MPQPDEAASVPAVTVDEAARAAPRESTVDSRGNGHPHPATPADSSIVEKSTVDVSAVEAGLDALDTPTAAAASQTDRFRRIAGTVLPPLITLVLVVVVWQALWASAIWPEFKLPAPIAVGRELWGILSNGSAFGFIWTSVHRALIGFVIGVVVAIPLGLLVAKVRFVRSAIGPLLSGLQSLPSVAWVPAAVLWFGVTPGTVYTVLLLGCIPSIANGLVAGIDQVPPILPRVGTSLGAGRLANARHILLPAALPGFLAGLKQGWAFSWRSLMAAEIIATSPDLGKGLGAYLDDGRLLADMSMVISAIVLILAVGIGIELLVFRPLERRVLTARGLAGAHR